MIVKELSSICDDSIGNSKTSHERRMKMKASGRKFISSFSRYQDHRNRCRHQDNKSYAKQTEIRLPVGQIDRTFITRRSRIAQNNKFKIDKFKFSPLSRPPKMKLPNNSDKSLIEYICDNSHLIESSKFTRASKKMSRVLFKSTNQLLALVLISILQLSSISCQTSTRSSETQGCPYPGVNANCQVNIVANAPAVPLLSTEYMADEYANLKADTQASYKCDHGFELLGQETLTCLPSGRWSGSPPNCVTNIAIGKPTNQSSTVKGGDSSHANDGRLGTQHESNQCTETRVDQSPWWQIDLLQVYEIRSVRLLGRACCNPSMSLHDIEIRVGNSSSLQGNRLCAWNPGNLDEGVARDFQCANPIVGRFVSIQMVGIEAALSLCEVMVFSTKEFPAERCNIQSTLAPSNGKQPTVTTTTTSATTTTQTNQISNALSDPLIVFNRTCYEMQAANGGSFLVADTYCKARGGALLHSVDTLTQLFISQELEKMKSKLKSKLVWLGAKRENSSPNANGLINSDSTSALISDRVDSPILSLTLDRNIRSAIEEFGADSLLGADHGLSAAGEPSPIFSPLKSSRTSLFQTSSGAGGSTSRGSQTFGLPSSAAQHQPTNQTTTHTQRSLVISQPSQVAAFFTPPIAITSSSNSQPVIVGATQTAPNPAPINPPSGAINFGTNHAHRSLRPPSLATTSTTTTTTTTQAPQTQSQYGWTQNSAPLISQPVSQSNSNWRWVGDAQSETQQSLVSQFLWAEDQPNNYNNQQDCIVLDGAKKWLWNDVTCELDYLPWVCQYRPSTCGSPDRNENSTILEMPSQDTLTNGVPLQEPAYQFGKTVTYACPVGHRMEGSKQRKCQYDGTWSGKAPKCQYVNCGPIGGQSLENGRIVYLNQSQTTYGSQVKYVCYEDYVLVGSDLRQCQAGGKWAGKQPYCAYKWCPVLKQISNGFLNVSSYSEGSIASYQCNSGYKLIGNDTRQCLLGGKWTNQEPFCQYVDCGQPKQIVNGNYQLLNSTTNYLSEALYTCNENYTLVGSDNKMICSHTNRWTGKEPQCSLIDCGQPQANPGSSFTGGSFAIHSIVEYKCDPGFKEVDGSSQRTCGPNGQWSGQPLTCKYVDCGRVPAILKGELNYINGTTYLASQVTYECTPGNRLSGHKTRFCGPDARWTGTSPKCEEIRCHAPELPVNGSAIYIGNDRSFKEQSFSVGVTVQYECDYGHVVKGNWASRLCQANGEWSGEPPICKFVDCGPPPNIENGNLVLKHPPTGSVGSATPIESTRRSDTSSNGPTSATYYGTIAHYSCDSGYKIQGPAQRECSDSGAWKTPMPTCEPVQCPKPEHFDEFTQVSLVSRSVLESMHQSGGANAPATSEHSALIMSLNMAGKSIRLIANNRWLSDDLSSSIAFGVGDKLFYSCVAGYELYGGPELRTCTQYGQWSGSSTPRCRLIDCGRPAPIGQEGRFYLLNETTTFNSVVEYSCVRPFKLIEMKVRQAGNLIETLNMAQAGVIPILTSLPIGVKVCANNGQWMPNDQQPKCIGATDASANGQFDGVDNTLDSSTNRHQVSLAGAANSNGRFIVTNSANGNLADGSSDNSLDSLLGQQAQQPAAFNSSSTSLWAKVIVALSMLLMLALIILTIICIRSGKKPKQVHRTSSIMATLPNGHPLQATNAMQIQLAGANVIGPKGLQQHQQQQHQAFPLSAQQASLMSGQGIYINGMHKMYQSSLVGNNQTGANSPNPPYGDPAMALSHSGPSLMLGPSATGTRSMMAIGPNDIMMNGKASSLGGANLVNQRMIRNANGQQLAADHNQMSLSASNVLLDGPYARLSIDSSDQLDNRNHSISSMSIASSQQTNKTIRQNPNGLMTFLSPAQQQVNSRSSQAQGAPTSQHQVSPQSISTSLSMSSSSSPSSSSSAHHTTATRLSATDSSSSTSSASNHHNNSAGVYQDSQATQDFSGGAPPPKTTPPSLPAHPPPPHRVQQNAELLLKQRRSQDQRQAESHYMDPTI